MLLSADPLRPNSRMDPARQAYFMRLLLRLIRTFRSKIIRPDRPQAKSQMIHRSGKLARSKIPKPLLSLGLLLLMGYTFELGGCGSSREGFAHPTVPIHADGYVPEDIERQIRACAAEHRVHLAPLEHNIAFDITFADHEMCCEAAIPLRASLAATAVMT